MSIGDLMTLCTQTPAAFLANIADAIEGGNTYRGAGTAYIGCPGTYSRHPDLLDGSLSTFTAASNGATTTVFVTQTGAYPWDIGRWVKAESPPWFLRCNSSAGAASVNNPGQARKITSWQEPTTGNGVFTVGRAFAGTTVAGDVFTPLEGFKRIPNNLDLMDEKNSPQGSLDRMFSLRLLPGKRMAFFGDGRKSYSSVIEVRLRIAKYSRQHDAVASAFENLLMMREHVVKSSGIDHRDGTYLRAIWVDDDTVPKIASENNERVITEDAWNVIYSIDSTVT